MPPLSRLQAGGSGLGVGSSYHSPVLAAGFFLLRFPRKTGLTAFAAVIWSSVSHALPGSWRALLAVGLSPSAFGPNIRFVSTCPHRPGGLVWQPSRLSSGLASPTLSQVVGGPHWQSDLAPKPLGLTSDSYPRFPSVLEVWPGSHLGCCLV